MPSKKQTKGEPKLDGVLIRLNPGKEEGTQQMEITALGSIKLTEIVTLLGLAKKQAEQQLGI